MLKKKEKFTAEEEAKKLPPNKYEFGFVIVKPGGKSSKPFVVEAEGHTEAEAIEAAKASVIAEFEEDELDNIVQYTGKFKNLGVVSEKEKKKKAEEEEKKKAEEEEKKKAEGKV